MATVLIRIKRMFNDNRFSFNTNSSRYWISCCSFPLIGSHSLSLCFPLFFLSFSSCFSFLSLWLTIMFTCHHWRFFPSLENMSSRMKQSNEFLSLFWYKNERGKTRGRKKETEKKEGKKWFPNQHVFSFFYLTSFFVRWSASLNESSCKDITDEDFQLNS